MTIPPESVPLLEARALTKSYRRGSEVVHALHDATFSIRPGQVVALMGPSGSGKTTLLNILCGWELPDAGDLLWNGEPLRSPASLPWRDVAILPQDLGLVEELSIGENVDLPVRLLRANGSFRERAAALIQGLELGDLEDRSPSEVSMGEQQRSALARALVLRPRLLLADEPTGHQDARWGRGVFQALRMAAREGTACLVATHNPGVLRAADRLLAIRDGFLREMPVPRAAQAARDSSRNP
jgi:putative ABC transport system ATP-binding protein